MRIGSRWVDGDMRHTIRDPYRGDTVAIAPESSAAEVTDAVSAACEAKDVMTTTPGYERARILRKAAALITEQADDIAVLMAREIGKAVRDARAEVGAQPGHSGARGGRGHPHHRRTCAA
jgi:acyl-CoA reductase-like NAD-dependent aldehyde dehydrogenase